MEHDQIIGKNLQALRKKLGLTQDQVAEYLTINRKDISYYENGTRSMPSQLMSQISNLYGVDEYDFYEENLDMASVNLALAFKSESLKPADLAQIANSRKL
jgi:transcriptional regulator with XRE-family HTH domain